MCGATKLRGYLRADGFCYFGNWSQALNSNSDEKDCEIVFDEFEKWARSYGASTIYGPIDGSTLYNYRLRLDSFDRKSFWGEPNNSKVPVEFLKSRRYRIAETYFSYEFSSMESVKIWVEKFLKHVPDIALKDLRFVPLTKELWIDRGQEFCALANVIFAENFAFKKVTYPEFRELYHGPALQLIDLETSTVVLNASNEIVGCAMNLRDPQNPEVLLLKTLGVLPAYRRMGATFFELIRQMCLRNKSYRQAILCLMKEGNLPSTVLKDFSNHTRTYGLFSKRL